MIDDLSSSLTVLKTVLKMRGVWNRIHTHVVATHQQIAIMSMSPSIKLETTHNNNQTSYHYHFDNDDDENVALIER